MNRRTPASRNSASAGAVRIIGGQWRGSKLPVADATGLRPTSDRARETLFNWLGNVDGPALHGARVLDLFAGSGALGLEAVSRGAREALLVERDPALAQSLRDTAERLNAGGQVQVVRADTLAWLAAPLQGRFDFVFLDPPFDAGLWPKVLPLLPPWLSQGAWLYVEAPASAPFDPGPGWRLHREGSTRDARHALYQRVRGAEGAVTLGHHPNADGASA